MSGAIAIYVLGVVFGVLCVDGGPMVKVGLALAWPLALVTFVATIATLIAVAAMAFPLFGAGLVVIALALWLLM